MDITANHIIATSSVVTALGVIFVALQAKYAGDQLQTHEKELINATEQLMHSNTQMSNDHERSRRENAINALIHFDQNLSNKASSSRKFVETLEFSQVKSLINQESFEIDIKCKELFLSCIKSSTSTDELYSKDSTTIKISEKISAQIRWQVIIYLNILETVLSAWRHNVADRNMIEEQFEFLVLPEEGHYILKDYRKAIGGKGSYPSIEEFAEYIENRRNKVINGKKSIT